MSNKTIVLGAGISGISTAYHLGLKNIDATIYEKDSRWGGLCDNFTLDGFRFDKSVHLSFASDEYVQKLLYDETPIYRHPPEASNYYEGHWVKHPAQNNLFPLPAETKVKILADFISNAGKEHKITDYESWLRAQYGDYFAEKFPMRYTRKYWTVDASELSTTWVGTRLSQPNIEEVLLGSYTEDIPNAYYAKEMRYPKKGGYKSFLTTMQKECNIELNKEATKVNPTTKEVTFSDGTVESYENLVSSLPIPHMIELLPNVPVDVVDASEKLLPASVAIVSLGFNKPDLAKHLWYYIYDEEFLPARCYSPSIKSPENVPEGCSSVQFEVYFSNRKDLALKGDALVEHVISNGIKMGLFTEDDIVVKDARILPYGNIIFYEGMEADRKIVLDYLASLKIYGVGRFGKWEYLWTDQCVLTGRDIVAENF